MRVGAILAEGGYGHHYQSGVNGLQVPVAKAQAVQVAGSKGLNQEISCSDQLFKQLAALWSFQVQGDAPFVGGVGPPEQTLLRVDLVLVERAKMPGAAATGGLYLHYVGPQVCQDLATKQAAVVGQVQHSVRAEKEAGTGVGLSHARIVVAGPVGGPDAGGFTFART